MSTKGGGKEVRNKLLLMFIILVAVIFGMSLTSNATDLDRIEDYEITVDVRNDGTLDMKYHIVWKVLDSTSEGPLEWVKIGIPNKKIDNIRALSDTIKSIRLYEELNGSYIRIDFDRAYMENEIIQFDFSFHQSYMYTINGNKCSYSFTPGWFDDIEVENLKIKWNGEKQISNNSNATKEGKYLVWNYALKKGRKVTAKIEYNTKDLNVNENMQYKNSQDDGIYIILFLGMLGFVFVSVIIIILSIRRGSYYVGRGYGVSHHTHHSTTSYHRGCACASSCACACACACAGGGRAGCSKKDFYGTKLKKENIK